MKRTFASLNKYSKFSKQTSSISSSCNRLAMQGNLQHRINAHYSTPVTSTTTSPSSHEMANPLQKNIIKVENESNPIESKQLGLSQVQQTISTTHVEPSLDIKNPRITAANISDSIASTSSMSSSSSTSSNVSNFAQTGTTSAEASKSTNDTSTLMGSSTSSTAQVASGTSKSVEDTPRVQEQTSSLSSAQDSNDAKDSRKSYESGNSDKGKSPFRSLRAIISGFTFTFLCYLYVKNTLTSQRDEVLFHINTLNAIKTMEQIEKERKYSAEMDEKLLKRKRDEVLDYHLKNMDFETSAWLRFTRSWNSIWKNISIEIDKQYEKEKNKDIKKQEERERFHKLGSSQSNHSP